MADVGTGAGPGGGPGNGGDRDNRKPKPLPKSGKFDKLLMCAHVFLQNIFLQSDIKWYCYNSNTYSWPNIF